MWWHIETVTSVFIRVNENAAVAAAAYKSQAAAAVDECHHNVTSSNNISLWRRVSAARTLTNWRHSRQHRTNWRWLYSKQWHHCSSYQPNVILYYPFQHSQNLSQDLIPGIINAVPDTAVSHPILFFCSGFTNGNGLPRQKDRLGLGLRLGMYFFIKARLRLGLGLELGIHFSVWLLYNGGPLRWRTGILPLWITMCHYSRHSTNVITQFYLLPNCLSVSVVVVICSTMRFHLNFKSVNFCCFWHAYFPHQYIYMPCRTVVITSNQQLMPSSNQGHGWVSSRPCRWYEQNWRQKISTLFCPVSGVN